MEGYQWGGRGGQLWEKVQGIRSRIGRHKLVRGRLRIVQGTEKPENLHVQPMDINWGGVGGILEGERDSAGSRGIQGRKEIRTVIPQSKYT